ncbi:MAG: LCCL domain-containing protein [Reyranellaceae bacterium]
MIGRIAAALLAATLGCAGATSSWAQEACPRNPGALAVGASVTCSCSPDALKSGAVFGSARYTSDSSLCRAAQHAGAIKDTGGTVTVHVAEGCPKYLGSSANGINTSNWGSATAKTFAFAKPVPACGLANVAEALKPGSATAPVAPPAAAGPAPKPAGNVADVCPANIAAINPGAARTCTCTADKISGMGWVYGTARYTPDSSICRAAAHAGAVPASGGPIVFYVAEGCPSSTGSESNNIKSASWSGPAAKTLVFAHPAPACGLASVAAGPKPTTVAATPGAAPTAPLPKDCPRSINVAGMSPGQSMTCGCTPDAMKFGGSVYGTDRYTSDSLTCVAARHAGKVTDKGGAVTVHVAASCAKFEGTERNGVSTRSWNSAVPQTFAFAAPVPPCVVAPVTAPPKPVAAPAPSAPPPGSPMAGWMARAESYAAALPEPLPGWTALKAVADASNSAMAGRYVSGFRQYRLGKHPAHLDSLSIGIANNPDGSARYPIEFWNDPAKATAEGYKKVRVAGRDAMEFTKKGGDTTDLFFLMPNNLFVTVSWQEAHLPRARMEEYLKVLDFAKIEKLASK